MNESVFPPLAIFQRPVFEVARKSTELMRSGADKIVQINFYASLAAIDNSTHHFSTLVNSQSIGDYSAPFLACRVTLAKVGLRCDALEGANKGFKYIGPLLMHCGRVGAKYAVVLRSLQGPKAA
jgi:hypothetical protein